MKNVKLWIVPALAAIVACSTPSQAPSPAAVSSSAPDAATVARTPRHLRHLRPGGVSLATSKPEVIDTRSVDQLADIACRGASGVWLCPARPQPVKMMASGFGPVTPPSWTVPAWYFDAANSTTCASDANSCTSATCGASGIGPCVTVAQVISERWGTAMPVLPQSTTFTALSAETVGQEIIRIQPTIGPGVVFSVLGTPKLVASFTLGTVTPKNRATPTLLQSTGFTAGGLAVGQMVVNTSRSSSEAKIYALSAGTATLTQPLAAITNSSASTEPGSLPAEFDTWTTGDSVSVYSLPILNVQVVEPTGGQLNGSDAGGILWMQWLTIPDSSGTNGSSLVAIQPSYAVTPWLVDMNFQTGVQGGSLSGSGSFSSFYINNMYDTFSLQDGTILGGGNLSFVTAIGQNAGIDGDTISAGVFVYGTPTFGGLAYVGSHGLTLDSGQFRIEPDWYATAVIWGPGGANVNNGSDVENDTGGVWHNACFLLAGTLELEGATTGTSYSGGTWTDGRALSAANFDTFQAIQSTKMTGARFFTQ
jgi:hypothetical protein